MSRFVPLHTYFFFFFNDTATTEIYTLSLHDALPIYCTHCGRRFASAHERARARGSAGVAGPFRRDRKSTRLNSSHTVISYAVFCLKKKKKTSGVNEQSKKSEHRSKQ